jgi:hypothetical protein
MNDRSALMDGLVGSLDRLEHLREVDALLAAETLRVSLFTPGGYGDNADGGTPVRGR